MARKKDTGYLHGSARAAYLESRLLTGEELYKAAAADTAQEAFRLLSGKDLLKDSSLDGWEQALEKNLSAHYERTEEMTGRRGITRLFRCPIDGHNLKVMVKQKSASSDFTDLYKPGGIASPEEMKREIETMRFEKLPEILGKAGKEAAEQLAKTGDPQAVDIIIDRAVIGMMKETAEETGSRQIKDYMTAKIDLLNAESAVRLLRMKKDRISAARFFFGGGSIPAEEWAKAYGEGDGAVRTLAERTAGGREIGEAAERALAGEPAALQHRGEQYFSKLFASFRMIPFGIEPILAFLYRKEQEIRGCRLVLASKLLGLPKEETRERLRCIYGD